MSPEQRRTHIRNNNLCYNCLAPGHRTTDCRSLSRCKQCSGCHHTMIHQDKAPSSQPGSTQVAVNTFSSSPTPSVPTSLIDIVLEGPRGQRLVARALLDSGASMSLVSARAAQHLQLPRTNIHITFSGVQGTPAKATNVLVILQLSSLQVDQPNFPDLCHRGAKHHL